MSCALEISDERITCDSVRSLVSGGSTFIIKLRHWCCNINAGLLPKHTRVDLLLIIVQGYQFLHFRCMLDENKFSSAMGIFYPAVEVMKPGFEANTFNHTDQFHIADVGPLH